MHSRNRYARRGRLPLLKLCDVRICVTILVFTPIETDVDVGCKFKRGWLMNEGQSFIDHRLEGDMYRTPLATDRGGFTLVELLVTISIIAMLVSMLLPAVQSAREAGRRTQCSNNLRQLGIGWLNHESAIGALPSGGWGWLWAGMPDRGLGIKQPGGWAYQVLGFTEEEALFELGQGLTGQAQWQAHRQRLRTPLSVHHCPSRREALPYPFDEQYSVRPFWSMGIRSIKGGVAKTDYAASIGDVVDTCCPSQPQSLEFFDSGSFELPHLGDHTGVSYAYSLVRMSQITDGTSKTYMIGEKYLNPDRYLDGKSLGDNESVYHGHNSDLYRSTRVELGPPTRDTPGSERIDVFGSPHAAGCLMAMCDGSVRQISFDVEATLHAAFGNREDAR